MTTPNGVTAFGFEVGLSYRVGMSETLCLNYITEGKKASRAVGHVLGERRLTASFSQALSRRTVSGASPIWEPESGFLSSISPYEPP